MRFSSFTKANRPAHFLGWRDTGYLQALTQAQKEEIVEKMTKDLGYNEETVRLCVDRDCTAP